MKNRSQRNGINSPRPRYGHKYTQCKMWFGIMIVICFNQYLRDIWSSNPVNVK